MNLVPDPMETVETPDEQGREGDFEPRVPP